MEHLTPAALNGVGGKLQGAGCPAALQDKAQATFNDFNNKMIDTDRMYQRGFAVCISVQREFEEELGVKVFAEELIDSYLFEVIPGKHVFIVTYGCKLQGPFEPRLRHEHVELRIFAVDSLPTRLPSGYRASIEAWHAKA